MVISDIQGQQYLENSFAKSNAGLHTLPSVHCHFAEPFLEESQSVLLQEFLADVYLRSLNRYIFEMFRKFIEVSEFLASQLLLLIELEVLLVAALHFVDD